MTPGTRHPAPPRSRSRPFLLGHRGARAIKTIPENTFASFDRALADGCDGFEFDVRLTLDQRAVIFHGPRAGRLEIAESHANQLPDLPCLQDLLARYREHFLDIELKVSGTERILLNALTDHPPRRFVVSSFLPEALTTLHMLNKTIPLGLICETRTQLGRWTDLPVQYVIVHRKLVRQRLVSELQQSGKKVLAWTINNAEEMTRFAAWGVDGLISDNTRLLAETLG